MEEEKGDENVTGIKIRHFINWSWPRPTSPSSNKVGMLFLRS